MMKRNAFKNFPTVCLYTNTSVERGFFVLVLVAIVWRSGRVLRFHLLICFLTGEEVIIE